MRDYKLGKTYKLHTLGNDDLIYYGSTIQTLGARLAGHRRDFKRWKNGKGCHYTSFKLFENENVVITLIENHSCNSKCELEARERFYIENNECVNKFIPTRTKKEHGKTDKMKAFKKEHHQNNKEKMNQHQKQCRKMNSEIDTMWSCSLLEEEHGRRCHQQWPCRTSTKGINEVAKNDMSQHCKPSLHAA